MKASPTGDLFKKSLFNKEVQELHYGTPHFRHEVVFYTPMTEEDRVKLNMVMFHESGVIAKTLDEMNHRISEEIGENFESDVVLVKSTFVNPFIKKVD